MLISVFFPIDTDSALQSFPYTGGFVYRYIHSYAHFGLLPGDMRVFMKPSLRRLHKDHRDFDKERD